LANGKAQRRVIVGGEQESDAGLLDHRLLMFRRKIQHDA
jgi:hypothetical protein